MAYNKTNWIANQTLVSANNLNKMEQGIEEAHEMLEEATNIDVDQKVQEAIETSKEYTDEALEKAKEYADNQANEKLGKNENAASASKLQTARKIKVDGAVTGEGTFDGSGDIVIKTDIAKNQCIVCGYGDKMYMKLCTIEITKNNTDAPITFDISGRSSIEVPEHILIKLSNGTMETQNVTNYTYEGSGIYSKKLKLIKISETEPRFELWLQRNQSWDIVNITNVYTANTGINIDWCKEVADSLPETNTYFKEYSIVKQIKSSTKAYIDEELDKLKQELVLKGILTPVYGVEIDYEASTVTRISDSFGGSELTPEDFNNISPWKDMKRVEKDGNIMVEIPNFWYKREILKSEPNPNGDLGVQVLKERRIISPVPLNGYKPMFSYADGVRDKVYIGAYEGSLSEDGTKLCSVPNVRVLNDRTRSQFRTLARNNGEGYQQQDFIIVSAIQWLFLVEYASFDSQSCIGLGYTSFKDTDSGINTGLTESLGNTSGQGEGDNGKNSVSYRGIENLWGNYWSCIDGINIDANSRGVFYWTNDVSKYAEDTIEHYTQGFNIAKEGGWVSHFGSISTSYNDFSFIPSSVIKTPNQSSYDYYFQNNNINGTTLLSVGLGGNWSDGGRAGCFQLICQNSAAYKAAILGSRLAYI